MATKKPTVTLVFAGDTAALEKSAKRAGMATDEFAKQTDRAEKSLEDLGKQADKTERGAMGLRDGVNGATDSMAGMAAMAQGDLGSAIALTGAGIADLSSTFSNTLIPMLQSGVKKLGVARLALLGLGGAAVAGAAALLIFANQGEDTSVQVDRLKGSLDVLAKSDVATGELRREFGTGADAVKNFAEKLKLAKAEGEAWNNTFGRAKWAGAFAGWLPFTRDVFAMGAGAQDAKEDLEKLDQAMADMVSSGMDAGVVQQLLTSYMGATNYEYAIANGLLPQYTQATNDAVEVNRVLGGALETTATQFRIASANLKTFMDLLRAQTDPIFAHTRAVKAAEDARRGLADAQREHGRDSAEAKQAQADLAQAELDVFYAESNLVAINENELLPTFRDLEAAGYLSGDSMAYLNDKLAETEDRARRAQGALALVQGFNPNAAPGFGGGVTGGGSFSGGRRFHSGGVVPGPRGAEVPILAQAGETIIPAGHSGQTIVIQMSGDIRQWLRAEVAAGGGSAQEFFGR